MRKRFLLVLTITVLLLVMLPLSEAAAPTEPDFAVSTEDIAFDPGSPVHVGTSVAVNANIHNHGICWIRLGEFLDYAGYNFVLDTAKWYTFGVEIRHMINVTSEGYVKILFEVPGLLVDASINWSVTVTTPWTNSSSGEFPALGRVKPLQTDHAIRIRWVDPGVTPADSDLLLDWVKLSVNEYDSAIGGTPTTTTTLFEAETYDPNNSAGVNQIYPCDVIVQFFDGDPGSGGSKINGDQTVGDENYVHDQGKHVKHIKNNGVAMASVSWTAQPAGLHDIYVTVDPSNIVPESNEGNNVAYKTMAVYTILTIAYFHGGTTDPAFGSHNYYGGTATVTAYPRARAQSFYSFHHWVLDGLPWSSTNPDEIPMNTDHNLTAVFYQPSSLHARAHSHSVSHPISTR